MEKSIFLRFCNINTGSWLWFLTMECFLAVCVCAFNVDYKSSIIDLFFENSRTLCKFSNFYRD